MNHHSKAGRIHTGFNPAVHHRFARLAVPLLCGLALLLPAAPARAAIAFVDDEFTTASTFGNASTALLLATNLTVSAAANTLVVEVTFRNSSTSTTEAPATLSWTNGIAAPQTLTLAVEKGSKAAGGGRNSAIYYLYNPTAGTGFNISGKLSGQVGSSGALVAYTLSGVDTTVASPPVNSVTQSGGAADTTLSFTINSISAGSWAAVGGVIAESPDNTHTITGGSGTPVLTVTGGGFSNPTSATMGYLSTVAGGSDTFTYTFTSSAADGAFAAAVFAPLASPPGISITAAAASPNPALVGSPVLLSVTTASTAGSITNVVVNASAIGGPSALPLNLSAGNVYTNSVTATLSSISASLPVTVQDSAGNVLMGGIPVNVETPGANVVVLQDGSTAITETNGSTVSQSLTVTAGANVLVVLVEDKGASAVNSEPATLAWGSQTILKAVAQDNPNPTLRGESIYYLFNPTPGTSSITAIVANSPTNVEMTAYTLSGANTNVAPQTGSGGDLTAGITLNMPNVAAGSFAAFNATWAANTPNPTVTGTGGTTTMTSLLVADSSGQYTIMTAGYISGLGAGPDTLAAAWAAAGEKNNFAVAVFAPVPSPISITAATASPNPVVVGSPVLLSVTAASTAGSITSVVVNASAIGGPSAVPLNISAGNVYTNSVTTTLASASASLPVTVQDNAGNVLAGSIPVSVETTNVVESSELRLVVYPSPFSFIVIEKATGVVLLQQTTNQFTLGGTYGVAQAANIAITPTTLDADLVLAGTAATGHITFNFIQPGIIQTTLSSSNNTPGNIFQQFADQGEDIFGGFECPTGGTLSTRNFSNKFAQNLGVSGIVNYDSAKAPFYLTTRHYGVYAQTDALGTLTFAQGGYTSFSFNVPQLTYNIIYGTNYATIMAAYNTLAGGSYMPPVWGFDSVWWKDDDHNNLPPGVTNAQGNVLDTANKLALYQIHAGSEWVDRPYGTSCSQIGNGWGNLDFDTSSGSFPNPPQMVSGLHARGINLMLWIADYCWCDLYDEGLADGYLFSTGTATTADFSNTNAFHWFQTNLNAFVNLGVMGYKIDRGDEGEAPDSVDNHNDTLFQQLAKGGLDAAYPNDGFEFSRCATDTARQYTALWSGDSYGTFPGLQYSVIAGLRAGIINFPMWGSDTGGYIGTPTEELFDRWFEFSAYSTIMEVAHGGGRTPWYNYSSNFSSPTNIVAIAAAQAGAHHDLIPYSRSCFYQATQTGMPVMRSIMFGYPNDTNETATITNCEYLFGPNILVAPVITAGATSRNVYLPADHWLDYNAKSNLYAGPANITAAAPVQTIPLFVREGAIIPRGDIFQGNNMWTNDWSPSLRIEFFPSDEFNSTFPYYTGSSVQTISCANQNQSRVIQFGNLGNSGILQIYVSNPGSVVCNGTNLNPGSDYSYNPANHLLQIPFAGATTVVVSNSTSLFSALWPSTPHITHLSLSGTSLSLSATNGTAGGSWTLLQSTNVALPLSQWQTGCAGNFDGSGNLSTNLPNTATNRQEFYLLKAQ